jgi:site-specific recombinase XerD
LVSFADGFRVHLVERGYLPSSARSHLELLADLSRWMEAEELDVVDVTPLVVERFLVDRRRRGRRSRLSPKGLRPLLEYLRGLGVLPAGVSEGATAVDQLVERFCAYLVDERGLAPGSVRLYAQVADRFLGERPAPLADALADLAASDIYALVLRESRRVKPRTAETVVCALRALLRFLHVHGFIAVPLADAVPSVPQRRENLPRGLPAGDVALLLGSCDRATAIGRRDYAILVLLARLGLRCGEVAALELDDVDWWAGELVIHGKRFRTDRLPLPNDVGEALADYLSRARPPGFGRTVFLRAIAPLTGLSGDAVSEVVHRACGRAGITPVRAHRLRHTVATELLRRGAALPEIGQVLRHHSVESTAVYAKVDRAALSDLALPWPGTRS